MRLGGLFSGYGGLEMSVQQVFDCETVWHCEFEDAPSQVLAANWPGVPNLGDITQVDWSTVEPVDILCGGFPCQDLSLAGRRSGMRPGTRSGLWADFKKAIAALQPSIVVIENVRGLLSGCAESDLESCQGCVGDGEHRPVLRALGRVLGDLAGLGFDAEWGGIRASDVGAPHGRFRVFIVAYRPGTADTERELVESGRSRPGGAVMIRKGSPMYRKLFARDESCVWHGIDCDQETLVPQHRAGKGGGGYKPADRLANVVLLCSGYNGLIETDAVLAQDARELGIKISKFSDPSVEPILHAQHGWVRLDDEGGWESCHDY